METQSQEQPSLRGTLADFILKGASDSDLRSLWGADTKDQAIATYVKKYGRLNEGVEDVIQRGTARDVADRVCDELEKYAAQVTREDVAKVAAFFSCPWFS
jgi:hypothetical protein